MLWLGSTESIHELTSKRCALVWSCVDGDGYAMRMALVFEVDLVDGQVSGLGTVYPLLTLNFFSTWILPLHVVFQR